MLLSGPTADTGLLEAVADAPLGQVIGRELNTHPIPLEDTDIVLAHLARDIGQHFVPIVSSTRNWVLGNGSVTIPSTAIFFRVLASGETTLCNQARSFRRATRMYYTLQ